MSQPLFVLDASMTLAWCFDDEDSNQSEAVLNLFRNSEALVPTLWLLEVSNALVNAERRGRLTPAESARFLEMLRHLPIQIEETSTSERTWGEILILARGQKLSTYDACYLDLAMRSGVPLATLDEALQEAAKACGVPLL